MQVSLDTTSDCATNERMTVRKETRKEVIRARVSERVKRRVQRAARAADLDESDLVRLAVVEFLDHQSPTQETA